MRYFLRALPLILGLLVWQILTGSKIIPAYLLPTPIEVAQVVIAQFDALTEAIVQTLVGVTFGLMLSIGAGLFLGGVLSTSKWARVAFTPYLVFFQTVPIVAIAPLLVIWFGFGRPTVVASSCIVSFFPMVANSMLGFRATEPAWLELFQVYGASRWQTFLKLRVPAALAQILTGTKIAAGLAVIGGIVGEFIAGGGLGGLIDSARTQQRLDLVFASVLIAALIGWLLVSAIGLLEWRLLNRWHPSLRKEKP